MILCKSDSEIEEVLNRLAFQAKSIKRNLAELVLSSRGAISWDEAHTMSEKDREIFFELISERVELTNKTGINFT